VVDVELLARADILGPQQDHDLIDLAGGRAGVLLRRGRDLPDRAVRSLNDSADAPQRLVDRLQHRGAGRDSRVDQAVDGGGLRHHERQGEAAEAGARRIRGAQAHPVAQAEGRAVEGFGGREVGHVEGDGFDG
jgi:hypothetical protein